MVGPFIEIMAKRENEMRYQPVVVVDDDADDDDDYDDMWLTYLYLFIAPHDVGCWGFGVLGFWGDRKSVV